MKILKAIKKFCGQFREKILFADLDGTIIVTRSGKTFPENCEDWQFKAGVIDAIRKYNPTHLFIVSNQGGIEKGFVDGKEWLNKINSIVVWLQNQLPNTKILYSYEVSNDKSNPRRKPNCGMLEEYYHDYYGNNDFSKRNAMMIGDASGMQGQFSDSDYQCAKNFGIKYLDVDYFIRWAYPCDYCSCKGDDCKYKQDQSIVGSFPCDQDLNIKQWIAKFERERNNSQLKLNTTMKVTKQPDGLYTIEASQGKTLVNETNGIHCHRAIDQTEAQVKDWTEECEVTNIKNSATTTPTTPEDEDERGV